MSSSSNCSNSAIENTKDLKNSRNIRNGQFKSYHANSEGLKTQNLETNQCLKTKISTSKIPNACVNDQIATRNNLEIPKSPKMEDKLFNKIKNEKTFHNEFCPNGMSTKSPAKLADEKSVKLEEAKYNEAEIKKEDDKLKIENMNIEFKKHLEMGNSLNRTKRSSSANGSPYKDRKRKKTIEDTFNQPTLTINQMDSSDPRSKKPFITKVYYSYFERTTDDKDEIQEMK